MRTQQPEAGGHSLKGKYGEVTRFLAQRPARFCEINTPQQARAVLATEKAEMPAYAWGNRFDSWEATFTALARRPIALATP